MLKREDAIKISRKYGSDFGLMRVFDYMTDEEIKAYGFSVKDRYKNRVVKEYTEENIKKDLLEVLRFATLLSIERSRYQKEAYDAFIGIVTLLEILEDYEFIKELVLADKFEPEKIYMWFIENIKKRQLFIKVASKYGAECPFNSDGTINDESSRSFIAQLEKDAMNGTLVR